MAVLTGSLNRPQGWTSSNGRSSVSDEVTPPTMVVAKAAAPNQATARHRRDSSRPSGTTNAMATTPANASGQPWVSQMAAARAPGRSVPVP